MEKKRKLDKVDRKFQNTIEITAREIGYKRRENIKLFNIRNNVKTSYIRKLIEEAYNRYPMLYYLSGSYYSYGDRNVVDDTIEYINMVDKQKSF